MGNYEIEFKVTIKDPSGEAEAVEIDLRSLMSEEEASSIDSVEKALLSINRKALKETIAKHLEALSKKKPKASETKSEE